MGWGKAEHGAACCVLGLAAGVAPAAVLTVNEDGGRGALLQLSSGAIWQYTAGGGLQQCRGLPSFPAPCQHSWAVPDDLVESGGARTVVDAHTIS